MLNAMKYIRSLEAVGFRREQAEAQVQLVYETLGEEVATKSDIAQIKSEMTKEFAVVRLEMATKSDLSAVRSEMAAGFAEVRSEVAQIKSEIIYKMGALFIASMTATTTIIGILIEF